VGSVFGPIRFLLPVCRLCWFLYTFNIHFVYAHFSSHFSKQLLMTGIWYLLWSLWPNIRSLPSIVAEKNVTKNVHICSMCIKTNLVGKQLFTFKSSSLKPLNRNQPNLPEMFTGWSSTRFVFLVLIWNPTWLPGSIMCSHWLKWPSNEHFCQVWFKSVLWFQKKRWKCEIPIGSYVKLSRVVAAILNFRLANDSQVIFVFGADRKSNMAARAHNVFWLVEI
jgi:hypothetical protein